MEPSEWMGMMPMTQMMPMHDMSQMMPEPAGNDPWLRIGVKHHNLRHPLLRQSCAYFPISTLQVPRLSMTL